MSDPVLLALSILLTIAVITEWFIVKNYRKIVQVNDLIIHRIEQNACIEKVLRDRLKGD